MKKNISVISNESFVNHTVLDGSNNEGSGAWGWGWHITLST